MKNYLIIFCLGTGLKSRTVKLILRRLLLKNTLRHWLLKALGTLMYKTLFRGIFMTRHRVYHLLRPCMTHVLPQKLLTNVSAQFIVIVKFFCANFSFLWLTSNNRQNLKRDNSRLQPNSQWILLKNFLLTLDLRWTWVPYHKELRASFTKRILRANLILIRIFSFTWF